MTWLLTLYPPRWRRRYGREFTELVATQRFSIGAAADLIAGAIDAWLHPQLVASATRDWKGAMSMRTRSASAGASVLLGTAGFIALYFSVLAGEYAGVRLLYLRDDLGLAGPVWRIAILSLIVSPGAYIAGLAMAHVAPNHSIRTAGYASSLFIVAIGILQLTVYNASVVPASILKVLFTTLPLLLGSAHRTSGRKVS